MEGSAEILTSGNGWMLLLTAAITYMTYSAKKRNEDLDAKDTALALDISKTATANAELALALEKHKTATAETYATKTTMMDLYKETTRTNEMAIAGVVKSIDSTNVAVGKTNDKLDTVKDSINHMQSAIMSELVKKT